MPRLNVRLFGKFFASLDEKHVIGLESCKLQELFSYLLTYRHAPHARETLAALLWGDNSTTQSKKYLRQALWQIQSALDPPDHCKDKRILNVEADWISINESADFWSDVRTFEQAYDGAKEIRGQNLEPDMALRLEEAVELYQADFLPGWYQDWCVCERERLQTNYLIMLDKLMSYCEVQQKYETGLTYGLAVLRYDRARESTHRRLMRLYYLAGDRTGALRQYEHCVAALKEELDVKPSRLTVALHEEMRVDEFNAVVSQSVPTGGPPSVLPNLMNQLGVTDRLKHLRQALITIHREVQKDIKAVEEVLDGWR